MSVIVRLPGAGSAVRAEVRRGYRLRPTSFALSIIFHVVLVAGLLLLPRVEYDDQTHNKPIYTELIKPAERKIIWYRASKDLPDVSAQEKIGTLSTPSAVQKAEVAIIATAPQPKSVKQFVWQPVPKVEIHLDLPSPNLIVRAAAAIPAAPPPPEPKPTVEKPDMSGVKASHPNVSPPGGDVEKAQQARSQPIEIPRPLKAFVAPPPTQHPIRVVVPVQTADVPLPDVDITGATPARAALPDDFGAPAFSKGMPPPPNALAGTTNSAGKEAVEVAVVGLHPTEAGPLPDGSRAGEFSRGPKVGEVATGEVKGGNGVPNLTIQDGRKPLAPPQVDAPGKVVLYADRLRGIPVTTFSVPLRPASRSIPPSIENRFHGRNVFSMVIPIENMQEYSGDWIIWFAERNPKPGDVPSVRAPVPLRKFDSVEPVPPGSRMELRVQIAGTISQEGKLRVTALLRDLSPALESVVLRDVQSWEFKPATRDRVPVDVDIVLEIPFSLPPRIARSSGP